MPDRPAKGLAGYDPDLVPEVIAFQRQAYPRRREDWLESRWRWMFERSASRLGVGPMIWLYRSQGQVVAHQGAIPVKLRTDGTERITAWFVETMALESARGKAVGPMLVAKALADVPFNLSLGQTPHMRELQFRLGWQSVAPLPTFSFVLNGRAVVGGKVPGVLESLAGAALNVYQTLRWVRGCRRLAWKPAVEQIDRFGEEHDALWSSVKGCFRCAVVRDASYLNWKYVDQPGQNFVRLELRQHDRVAAIAVVSVDEPDDTYRYRRANLTELVVSPREPDVVWAILDAVRNWCRDRHADLLLFDILSSALVPQVCAFGFARRRATRVLLVAPGPSSSMMTSTALDPEAWLITRGDSDIDRPW